MRKMCVLVMLLFLTNSCASLGLNTVKTGPLGDEGILSGDYSIIRYGGTHGEDVETAVIMDIEGDEHTFVPYASEYQFAVKKHVPDGSALEVAVNAVSGHYAFLSVKVSKIMDRENHVLGYEVRPLYTPLRFGFSDILDVHYFVRDKSIYFYVELKPRFDDLHKRGRDVDTDD